MENAAHSAPSVQHVAMASSTVRLGYDGLAPSPHPNPNPITPARNTIREGLTMLKRTMYKISTAKSPSKLSATQQYRPTGRQRSLKLLPTFQAINEPRTIPLVFFPSTKMNRSEITKVQQEISLFVDINAWERGYILPISPSAPPVLVQNAFVMLFPLLCISCEHVRLDLGVSDFSITYGSFHVSNSANANSWQERGVHSHVVHGTSTNENIPLYHLQGRNDLQSITSQVDLCKRWNIYPHGTFTGQSSSHHPIIEVSAICALSQNAHSALAVPELR